METDELDIDAPQEVSIVRLLRAEADGQGREEAAVVNGRAVLLARARGAARSELAGELAAAGIDHPHLTVPFDHWTEGEWLVLAYPMPTATLADRLSDSGLSPGAVVTVLAPVLDVLERLHRDGIAGVDLSPQAIAIDDSGAPALMLRGARARTRQPTPRWRAECPAVQRDALAAQALLSQLASSTAVPEEVTASIQARDWTQAAERLLAWAAPLPLGAASVAFDPERSASADARPTRRSLRSTGRRSIGHALAGTLSWLWHTLARLRDAAGAVRPRVWALGAAGLASVLAAVTLMSAGGAESSERVTGNSTGPVAIEQQPPTESAAPAVGDLDDAELAGVLTGLLLEREHCLGTGDTECIDAIVQSGSLLHRDDAAGTPAWRHSDGTVVVEQRIGDAAIARIESETQPASMLAVSTEAGWMIREIWR